MDRRAFLRRTAPLALVGLAGCTDGGDTTDTDASSTPTATDGEDGSSDGDGGTGTPTATDETEDTPTAEPTDEPTDDPSDSPTSTEESTPTPEPDTEIVVGPDGKLEFSPKSFTISTGDTVLWTWDSGGHNVSPKSIPDGSSWTGKDESTYSSGTTHVHTFETAGSYDYVCTPHQSIGMTGSFTVE